MRAPLDSSTFAVIYFIYKQVSNKERNNSLTLNQTTYVSIFIFVFVVGVVVHILLLVSILALNHLNAFATLACVLANRNFLFVNEKTV